VAGERVGADLLRAALASGQRLWPLEVATQDMAELVRCRRPLSHWVGSGRHGDNRSAGCRVSHGQPVLGLRGVRAAKRARSRTCSNPLMAAARTPNRSANCSSSSPFSGRSRISMRE
jgi:hypothetical protein